jgi:hypothetical protein
VAKRKSFLPAAGNQAAMFMSEKTSSGMLNQRKKRMQAEL